MVLRVYGIPYEATIDIPDELAIRAKKKAVDLRRPFRDLVIEGLRARLDRDQFTTSPSSERTIRWVSHPGGVPADVDISSRVVMTEWLHRGE